MRPISSSKTVLVFTMIFLGNNANAIELQAIDADQQIRQQQRDEALEKKFQAQSNIKPLSDKNLQSSPQIQYLKSNSENVCFDIKKLILKGESADQFGFALKAVTQGEHKIIDRCIGVQGLNQAMNLIQNRIIAYGFVTSRVLLAPQNIASGHIVFKLIPGKVDQIKFAEPVSKRAHKFNALPLSSGDILNIRDIEQGLENFKRVPSVEADFKIQPSTSNTEPGFSDLVLAWQQSKPYRLHLGLDDAGSDSTGKYQGTATLSLDNLFTVNDLFYGGYNHDLGGGGNGQRGTDGFYLNYSIPFGYWLFSTSYSKSDYNQSVAAATQSYVYSGKSKQINSDLSRVIYRNTKNKTTLSVGGWYRESQNYIDEVEVEVQRRKTSGWKASLEHSAYLSYATLNGNLTYRRGAGAFNAIRAPEEAFNEAYTHVGIIQANVSMQVPFEVGQQNLQYLSELRIQHSKKPLTAQDRFSIGNRYTVRGYDGEQTLLADNGLLIRNELSGSIMSKPHMWYAAIDYGEVGGQTAYQPNPLVGTYLLGAATGLRGQILKTLSYDVFVGTPLKKPDLYKTDSVTTGFNLNWVY